LTLLKTDFILLRQNQQLSSVHLGEFPVSLTKVETDVVGKRLVFFTTSPEDKEELMSNWKLIFSYREGVLNELEKARNEKIIGSSLEAKVVIAATKPVHDFLKKYEDYLRYIFIVSQVDLALVSGHSPSPLNPTIIIQKADGAKCERCWNYSARVGESEKYPTVCERCIGALIEIERSAAA
jgi:isoleucyl-tRNA synthetase